MKNTDTRLLPQIQKAHSIGSIVTMISFLTNVFSSRVSRLEFLSIPLIIIVSMTIIGSIYYFFLSVKHKELLENPMRNNIAFIFRILINMALLILMNL